jgi:hypothetical protein
MVARKGQDDMRRNCLAAVWLAALTLRAMHGAAADPIISYRTSSDFATGIAAGRFAGSLTVPPDSIPLSKEFPGEEDAFRTTTVNVATAFPGMLSKTGSAPDLGTKIAGAYLFRYGLDPDLANVTLEADLFLPEVERGGGTDGVGSGLDTVAFAVVDAADRVKLWRFDQSVLTQGDQTFTLNLSGGPGEGGSTSFQEDPGFNLGQAEILQVGYRGTLTANYPLTPDEGQVALWIGTKRFVTTVPEPGALLVFPLGISGLFALRRRRRLRP